MIMRNVLLVAAFAAFCSNIFAAAQARKSVTFQQLAELTASDGAPGDALGYSLAMSGNTVVAGAEGAGGNTGKAYVFVKPDGGWANATQTAELTPSDGAPDLYFGFRVAISGSTIVVDAGSVDGSAVQAREYVFVEPPGGWTDMTETAQLALPNGIHLFSVAVAGNVIVAAATEQTVGSNSDQGAVYVFQRPKTGWGGILKAKAKLTASNGAAGNFLGFALAFDGNAIVATALNGIAYVYVKPADGWESGTETAQLAASPNGGGGDGFGESAAIAGKTIIVGAPEIGECVGGAYLYYEPSGGWISTTQSVAIAAPDQRDCGYFGASVAVSGNLAVVGANGEGSDYQGAAYVFYDATQIAELIPSDDQASEEMGVAVAASGSTAAAGAAYATIGSNNAQGKVYVFGR
jgi:hypothetical protein